ncbi:glycosyltransferase [Dactylosporangium sucinum]|uniref:Glycosyl transferase n=1 Tax=Dactylosporangium sucinum TaxID=1424081 RepID=A0A917TXT2_9ACTN|nr:glycosyltransferase [Dactylosporangium sucinum]GGM41846.1 glycosyl transferase [Dactylosporangium sucinum]
MRIALVSAQASPLALGGPGTGGQHTHVAALAGALGRLGHDVRVYTRREDPDTPGEAPFAERVIIEHVTAGPPEPLPVDELLPLMGDFGRALASRWQHRDGPDVVHAHFWLSGLAALTATAEHRRPVIETYHGLGAVRRRHLKERDTSPEPRVGLERTLGTLVDRVVAQCEDEVTELGRMGIRRADTVIVPSGVDGERFTPGGPAADRPRPGMRRILSVGPLVERKGFADLIEALRRVPGAELVVVGGPDPAGLDRDPEARRLTEFADRCGVGDRVRLIGAVPLDDLPGWYRSADVLACAPWYEPFGLTPLEGMSCGVPVVAYEVGGIAESVIDNVTGVLVPPRDTNALAAAVRGLLGDEVRRMSYASAAIDRVRSRYTWERTATDLERVYAAVTGGAAGSADEDVDEDDEALSEVSS